MILEYAILADNIVTNVVLIDDEDKEVIELLKAIPVGNQEVRKGYLYEDLEFINPNNKPIQEIATTIIPLSDDELAAVLTELSIKHE